MTAGVLPVIVGRKVTALQKQAAVAMGAGNKQRRARQLRPEGRGPGATLELRLILQAGAPGSAPTGAQGRGRSYPSSCTSA